MPVIISKERFLSQSQKCIDQYKVLREQFPEDETLKKIGRWVRPLKTLYDRDKVYAVKHLHYLEASQVCFDPQRRALVVQIIELLQKLILHKKRQSSRLGSD